MPVEYEFMKSARDKEMPDDEYTPLREEYDQKAVKMSGTVKKTLVAFLAVFAVSFIALYLYGLFVNGTNNKEVVGNYTWLAVEFLLAVFFYGLKVEDNQGIKYETDKRILLRHVKNKISAYKLRLGLVIGFGLAFAILNILCWWFAVSDASMGPASEIELLAVNTIDLIRIFI